LLYKAKQIGAVIALITALAACGFSPIYKAGNEAMPVIGTLKINDAFLGGILANEIRSRSQRGVNGYDLVIQLSEAIVDENIGRDREASRQSVKIILNYQIITADGLTKQTGTLQQTDVFSSSRSEFTNRSEIEQARSTVLRLLAGDIIQLLNHRNRAKTKL
jgi:hypothetical protein